MVLFTADEHRDRIGTHSNVVFWSADVKKTYAELKAKGVQFLGEPQTPDGGSSAILQDAEGNKFVLSSK